MHRYDESKRNTRTCRTRKYWNEVDSRFITKIYNPVFSAYVTSS